MAAAPHIEQSKKRPRAVPDDALIYREHAHQIMTGGEWGAYSRTGRSCNVSHEHVRKVVARHDAKASRTDANVHDDLLAYQPAPGELELAAQHAQEALLCQLLLPEIATGEGGITSTPGSIATATVPEVTTPELGTVKIPATIICSANHIDRTEANRRIAKLVMTGMCVVLTIACISGAYKSLWLALTLYPEMLGMWWILAQFRRLRF